MSSRAQLDKVFPLLVERHTDERGFIDWHSVVEDLWMEEFTTIRNRVWKWRNAEAWWLRNRKRIMEERRACGREKRAIQESREVCQEPLEESFIWVPTEGNLVQLAFDF